MCILALIVLPWFLVHKTRKGSANNTVLLVKVHWSTLYSQVCQTIEIMSTVHFPQSLQKSPLFAVCFDSK